MCDDEQLHRLLHQICASDPLPKPLDRARAMTRLLICIQKLPNLYRSTHQDYPAALNLTLEAVSRNICQFSPRSDSVSESLGRWVNAYLKWRLKDLHRSDREYDGFTPLDESMTKSLKPAPNPDSGNLQAMGQQIRKYIEADEQDILKRCHPRNHPECNAQALAIRVQLNEPPDTIRKIAAEFGIPEQTLYTHWREKCKPRLRLMALRFDPQLKQGILENQARGKLTECHLPEHPACNCWSLAEQLLLAEFPQKIEQLAQALNILKESDLWHHWERNCLPILKRFRSYL